MSQSWPYVSGRESVVVLCDGMSVVLLKAVLYRQSVVRLILEFAMTSVTVKSD